ncbi:GNAT family N-acetyltransferase, partial [Halapricum sp. CBA1109]|uniref:GNAT family N-acetyltransferase n=1 Tax=Halapricum sp. CBA1109 TaxID=2668068 RepID=UPI0012F78A7F
VLAAAAFDADRTDQSTLVIRYVTVRADRRGEGIGPRLLAFVRERARENGFERVRINVNNVYSYVAALKAGYGFTGEETGVAELCMIWPADRAENYDAGLALFEKRDVTDEERHFLAERPPEPPATVDPP